MTRQFVCEQCKEEFDSQRTDEDCMKEFSEKFPECKGDPLAVVCDTCFAQINAWLNSLSMEEKFDMRQRMRTKYRSQN